MFLVSGAAATTQPCSDFGCRADQHHRPGCIASLGTSRGAGPEPYCRKLSNAAANAGTSLNSHATTCTSKRAMLATFSGASSFIAADNWLTAGTSGAAGAVNGTVVAFAYWRVTSGATGKISRE